MYEPRPDQNVPLSPPRATVAISAPASQPEHRRAASDASRGPAHLRLVRDPARVHPTLQRWDPRFIRRIFPALARFTDVYYRADVEGAEHLSDRASLIVSTHNGLMATPDAYTLAVAFWRRFGPDAPAHGLMHRAAFRVPLLGRFLQRLGAIYADEENAARALAADRPIFIAPGGDIDALKPFRDRHKLYFGARRGFVRLALRAQVPIIPVVSVGAHETQFVLNDGRKLARRFPLARKLRVKTIPFALGFPFGITIAGLGNLPLPTKVTQRILSPIVPEGPPEAADDPEAVERLFERVRQAMQAAIDELAAERRWPVIG